MNMLLNFIPENAPNFNFANPVESPIAEADPLFSELIATEAFQRLKTIRFLGGIDYVLIRSPNGAPGNIRYTRYQHSLGVARLALLYCSSKSLPLEKRRLAFSAALLHDIGHAPLSHSLEPVFKEVFDLTHHEATENIVTGRVPLGTDVFRALRRHSVDVERVVATISGKEDEFDGFFSKPINFDTIDGIMRALSYKNTAFRALNPIRITMSAIHRRCPDDMHTVDAFWCYKDKVYQNIINSRMGVLADFACQFFMRRNLKKIRAQDYFAKESVMFRRLPGLRELLSSTSFEKEVINKLDGPLSFSERRFFIDPNSDFSGRKDKERYRQSREVRTFTVSADDGSIPVNLTRDMFQ